MVFRVNAHAISLPVRNTEKRENLENRSCLMVVEVEEPALMLQRDRLDLSVSVDTLLMLCSLLRSCMVCRVSALRSLQSEMIIKFPDLG